MWNIASGGEALFEMGRVRGECNACSASDRAQIFALVIAREGGRSSIPEES
jgi:hypothetical protein